MEEQVVGSESVTIEKSEESEELSSPSLDEMTQLSLQVVQALQAVVNSGDSIVAVVCAPALLEEFTAAFRSLPEEILPAHIRDNLPVVPEESVERVKVVTGTDIELQFLQVRYGERESGGNGLIPDLRRALESEGSPVRVGVEFLRHLYLTELVERSRPKLYTPTTFDPSMLTRR